MQESFMGPFLFGVRSMGYFVKMSSLFAETMKNYAELTSDIMDNYAMMNDVTAMRYRKITEGYIEEAARLRY